MLSLNSLASKIFGSRNDRMLKSYNDRVAAINALEDDVASLSDEELQARTETFRKQFADGTSLDDLLIPAFATVREAAKRTLKQRHFDVQLIGGIVLHESGIAEMKTGEGKTLVATLPVYLNALSGKGVHVVTVNDYLAKRDAEWMGQVYKFLGLTVGCITNDVEDEEERLAQYAADVTYGTNNEFGFDYLRDNMKYERAHMVQRGHNFAIVDEVDSILIDEARTPLIISGPVDDKSELYTALDGFIPHLTKDEDFELDEKQKQVSLTEAGNEKLEAMLQEADLLNGDSLYDAENVTVVHHINQALRAHTLFLKDRDYIVKNDEVVIIDEFTGRMMEGRRYSDGQHQALEAKEKVTIQPENQTMASITFQNYFRLYDKLAGMTGTALTEADEFMDIYGLDVVEIPTNRDLARIDDNDEVYRTMREKFRAIVELIADCHTRGQPILVGTTSIEKSEVLASMLSERAFLKEIGIDKPIPHQVLNARFHEQEARIISQAGVPGAVTIATNMAGRGTDIQLGGNPEMMLEIWEDEQHEAGREPGPHELEAKLAEFEAIVDEKKKVALDAGGLYVVGTERHESRRIDNQLRGRSGRQGDPGHSRFFLSLEDDLMRIFGSDRMDGMLQKLGLEEGEAIVHPWINRALAKAQSKVEARNFDLRKNILKYDDVMNDQRKVIFEQRLDLMDEDSVADLITEMRHETIDDLVSAHIPENAYAEQWDIEGLKQRLGEVFGEEFPVEKWADEEGIADQEIRERLVTESDALAARQAVNINNSAPHLGDTNVDPIRVVEKSILLQSLDRLWREHLSTLEHLRNVIGLRGYGQRDPLNEYKSEGFTLFESMLAKLREEVTMILMNLEAVSEEDMMLDDSGIDDLEGYHEDPDAIYDEVEFGGGNMTFDDGSYQEERGGGTTVMSRAPASKMDPNDPSTWGKVARNAPCPCGSGKKFKRCHGQT